MRTSSPKHGQLTHLNNTLVLWCKLLHLVWHALIEVELPGDKRLAHSDLIKREHVAVPSHLVNEWLQLEQYVVD